MSLDLNDIVRVIRPEICLAFFTVLLMCSSKFRSGSTHTPRSFSKIVSLRGMPLIVYLCFGVYHQITNLQSLWWNHQWSTYNQSIQYCGSIHQGQWEKSGLESNVLLPHLRLQQMVVREVGDHREPHHTVCLPFRSVGQGDRRPRGRGLVLELRPQCHGGDEHVGKNTG